jgi:regulator of replication initiation timing
MRGVLGHTCFRRWWSASKMPPQSPPTNVPKRNETKVQREYSYRDHPTMIGSMSSAGGEKGDDHNNNNGDEQKKRAMIPKASYSSSGGDDEDSYDDEQDPSLAGNPPVEIAKRAKRLAMNRDSARARRKRKKETLESLGNHSSELADQNRTLRLENEALRSRTQVLESSLGQAQATINALSPLLSNTDAAVRQHSNPRRTNQQLAGLAGLVAPVSQLGSLRALEEATQQRNLQVLLQRCLPSHHQSSSAPAYAAGLASMLESLQSQRPSDYSQLLGLIGHGDVNLQPNISIASPPGRIAVDRRVSKITCKASKQSATSCGLSFCSNNKVRCSRLLCFGAFHNL